ncbi:MAG: sulfurtransferase [Chloroflexi bacterium]|nr:sulfurtransferase [Chloroflexota bacterium]
MSHFETYISCAEAAAHLQDSDWLFIDCRFALMDKAQGRREYQAAHIAGAVFADLDGDLSAPHVSGVTGRHPLPAKDDFVHTLRRLGVTNQTQVVVYDAQAGQLAAGRLWWMLKWAGHVAVAVLDGGFGCWQAGDWPLRTGTEARLAGDFAAHFDDGLQMSVDEMVRIAGDPAWAMLDSRAADRFRGENETIDPIGGHIPGARSAPFAQNIAADGRLRPADEIASRFDSLADGVPAERCVFYCGSGVSAVQNILAWAHVYGTMPRLYVGSWSEWIIDASRTRASGEPARRKQS